MAGEYPNRIDPRIAANRVSRGVIDRTDGTSVDRLVPLVKAEQDRWRAPVVEEYVETPVLQDTIEVALEPIVPPQLEPAPTFLQTTGDVARVSWPALATAGVLFFGAGLVVGWYRKRS